jgi:hypothetical protein
MTDKVLLPTPGWQFIVNGKPFSGGKVFIYEAGSTTKATTWTAEDGLTPNTNPAILDAEGRANFWVPPLDPVPVSPIPPGPRGPPGPDGPAGPPGPTGNASEFSVTTDITAAQIYDWFGNYYEIAPTVVADNGTIYVPVQLLIGYKYSAIPFATNSANFVVNWGPPIAPTVVPNSAVAAAVLENVFDSTLSVEFATRLDEVVLTNGDCIGKNLTLTLDAAVDGAPLVAILVFDGGSGYAVSDTGTIDGGDSGATYEVLTVDMSGAVLTISLTAGGVGYPTASVVTTATGGGQPGVGTGLTLDTTSAETAGGMIRTTVFYRKFIPL